MQTELVKKDTNDQADDEVSPVLHLPDDQQTSTELVKGVAATDMQSQATYMNKVGGANDIMS